MKELDFSKRGDGSHRGLSDWYPENEKALEETFASGEDFTTGWYSSKHEIASARITRENGLFTVEVSVSDDFDTEVTEYTNNLKIGTLDALREVIGQVWDAAIETQADERASILRLYAIRKDSEWVESYLAPVGISEDWESPPGDYYYKWGFQNEGGDIPEDIKKEIVEHITNYETSFQVGDYTVSCED